jgi:hypothetical protein
MRLEDAPESRKKKIQSIRKVGFVRWNQIGRIKIKSVSARVSRKPMLQFLVSHSIPA